MSADGQRTNWYRNIAENFNRLSRTLQTDDRPLTSDDRQTTDGRTMTYSERELTFTFAKNNKPTRLCPVLYIMYTASCFSL